MIINVSFGRLKQKIPRKWIPAVSGVLIIGMILLYNHVRVRTHFHPYQLGFSNKQYYLDAFSFSGILEMISDQFRVNAVKTLFWVGMGFMLRMFLVSVNCKRIWQFVLTSIGVIAAVVVLFCFTFSYSEVFKLNNLFFYAVGLSLGFFAYWAASRVWEWIQIHWNFWIHISTEKIQP